jgi:hypothetical protein
MEKIPALRDGPLACARDACRTFLAQPGRPAKTLPGPLPTHPVHNSGRADLKMEDHERHWNSGTAWNQPLSLCEMTMCLECVTRYPGNWCPPYPDISMRPPQDGIAVQVSMCPFMGGLHHFRSTCLHTYLSPGTAPNFRPLGAEDIPGAMEFDKTFLPVFGASHWFWQLM